MIRTAIRDSAFRHAYQVTASDLNRYGMMHGGRLLTLCDEAGYCSAHHHADCDCLTRAVHQARFHHAIKEGECLSLRARVGLTGYSSLWVFIEVIRVKDDRCMMDAVFVYAAIDEKRKAIQVPAIDADSDEEKLLQARLKRMKDAL